MRNPLLLGLLALALPMTAAEAGLFKKKKQKDVPVAAEAPAESPVATAQEALPPPPPAPVASAPPPSFARETFTPPPERPTVADKVGADWPKYDVGKKGHLTRTEFGKWMSDLRVAGGQAAPDAGWVAAAFAQTDSNGDRMVSKDELVASLTTAK